MLVAGEHDDLVLGVSVLEYFALGRELNARLVEAVLLGEPVVALEEPRALRGARIRHHHLLEQPARVDVVAVVLRSHNVQ